MMAQKMKVFDLVCGMELAAEGVRYASEHKGETYYFCSASCKKHFDDDPQKYAGAKE